MLQAEYSPLCMTKDWNPSIQVKSNRNRWHTAVLTYGIPALLVVNVGILAVLGIHLHINSRGSENSMISMNMKDNAMILPSKYAVNYVTPYKDQAGRGTCWDFGTIGALEQSYRKHGIERGWLRPDEYVSFSEQAYGIEIMKLCTGGNDSPQQEDCRIADDNVWRNSTEGGEVPLLYYLESGLNDVVFPSSICPYKRHMGNDWTCNGLDQHRLKNPISFKVNGMGTFYDEISIKRELVRTGTAMPLSTTLVSVQHYYPCIGSYASDPRCAVDVCDLCPPELPMSSCCIPVDDDTDGQNMEGEFLAHSGMQVDGGHVMLLVAFNDLFQTREGVTGGMIVKNSWADGWQGSHSLKYWMQDISEWEERVLCPNSYNPFNWYMPTEDDGLVDIAVCLSQDSITYSQLNRQPLHLRCVDSDQCDEKRIYFARNRTTWGDRMHVMCFWEYEPISNTSKHICLEPMLQESIADTFIPVETYENDPDQCGFYFLPYDTIRRVNALFQGFFVNSFEIEWAPESYLSNSVRYPQYDYSLLRSSTKKQETPTFDGPFPFAQRHRARTKSRIRHQH